ncbi:MAG TPA: hypothetical protein VN023_01495 [Methylovorus sp.]|jgi:hypothetical protein|nr:hypothetical protein [Methylovorus sp.]
MMENTVQAAWEAPVVCRVEVDLPGWMEQLTGRSDWEVYGEEEDDGYMSFAMRQGRQQAEVTLYHNGYAVVDVDGRALFDGALTPDTSPCAHLSYYRADSGEQIVLN